ncbi:MAG TPA: acyltransferase [Trichormus sp. M33_DOE_039]|nr:acyltransferase [Trichormus sp. M33_DOE_039]
MNNPVKLTRFKWIDQIKGLAILAIILFHFFQNYPDRLSIVTSLDRIGAKLGYAAVDLFFVMAGLNTSYALISKLEPDKIDQIHINWKSWVKKRLSRIYPAYILAFIISCLLYYLFGIFKIKSLPNFSISFIGLAGKDFQEINPGFWFFTVILEAYLLTPLIFILCKNQHRQILILGSIIGTLSKLVTAYFFLNQNHKISFFLLQNNFLGSYIFQFCLGIYWGFIYAKYKEFRKIDFWVVTLIFLVGSVIYAILGFAKVDIIYMLGFDALFTPFMFLGIKEGLCRIDRINKLGSVLDFLSILGIYSYQIYLIHQPLYFVILPKINKFLQINSYSKISVSLIISLSLLTVYVFLFTKLEKYVIKMVGSLTKKTT